jgi:hypothetical protein
MDDEWARWDADQVKVHANRLARTYFTEGRLPYPCVGRIRDAYECLGRIVTEMDKKLEELE